MGNHVKQRESGIFIGNQLDKSSVRNPIARAMVRGFDAAALAALRDLNPNSVHEVGCGEARMTRLVAESIGAPVLGTDFSAALIEENKAYATDSLAFEQVSIYDLDPESHRRDVVVCCEVLEHLEFPERGLSALGNLRARAYLLSVPREPIWRALNMARGMYWSDLGNTPGHLNHWSPRSFARFLKSGGFRVQRALNPFPWIMVVAVRDDA